MSVPEPTAESELQYLASLAEVVTNLTGRFLRVDGSHLDTAIDDALRLVGQFAGVDRSYVFRFSDNGSHVSNTHEWCAEGIEPEIGRMQDTPVEDYAWALRPLQRGEVLYIPNVAALPPEAAALRRELQSQRVKTVLNVPLQCAGKALGFVGFDSVRTPKSWGERHIRLLRVVGEIIAGSIERDAATSALQRQVRLETMVANISTHFVHVPLSRLDEEIDTAIASIGRFTGVDRSYLFQFSADGTTMTNTHEWCAPGIEPHIDRLQDFPVEGFAYSMASMRNGKVFYVPDVSKLPAEAAGERAEFEKEGIRTLVNVPIMIGGTMHGFLGLDAVRERKLWSEDDHRLLILVGEIFANALSRKRADERLAASLEEKEILLREIHHRVKNNLQIVDSLLYLQMNAIRDRVEPEALDAFRQSQNRIRTMAQIHEQLYRSQDLDRLGFSNYLARLVDGLRASYTLGSNVEITVCDCNVTLGIDRAIPCGLIINELVTNSLKHAFPDGRSGQIRVCLEQTGATSYRLKVTDNGTGFTSPDLWSRKRSLGLRLVKDLAQQLGGTVTLESGPGGSEITVCF